jgi:hypothetical protein
MRHRLRAVHQHRDMPRAWASSISVLAGLMVPRALEIWTKATSFTRPLSSSRSYSSRINSPASVNGATFKRRAGALAQQLPRHDVGMMLHAGDDDFIAGPDHAGRRKLLATRLMLSVVAGEDDLLDAGGVQKGAHLFPRLFVGDGGAFRQQMNAAMDVGVIAAVTLADGVNHRFRLLHRSGVIQINQRLAVNPLAQNGKFGADAGQIQLITRPGQRGKRGAGRS